MSLAVSAASQLEIKSRLSEIELTLRTVDGDLYDSYRSVEAACLSGVAYASRALRARELHVDVLNASGTFYPSDVEGFAIAASLAVASGLGRSAEMPSGPLSEWEVTE